MLNLTDKFKVYQLFEVVDKNIEDLKQQLRSKRNVIQKDSEKKAFSSNYLKVLNELIALSSKQFTEFEQNLNMHFSHHINKLLAKQASDMQSFLKANDMQNLDYYSFASKQVALLKNLFSEISVDIEREIMFFTQKLNAQNQDTDRQH